LIEFFKNRFAAEMNKGPSSFAPITMELLCRHTWPGNIRELQSVIKFALIQATSSVIVPEFLPPFLLQTPPIRKENLCTDDGHELAQRILDEMPVNVYQEWMRRTDTVLLDCVLKRT